MKIREPARAVEVRPISSAVRVASIQTAPVSGSSSPPPSDLPLLRPRASLLTKHSSHRPGNREPSRAAPGSARSPPPLRVHILSRNPSSASHWRGTHGRGRDDQWWRSPHVPGQRQHAPSQRWRRPPARPAGWRWRLNLTESFRLIPLGFVRPASAVNTQDECCTTAWASRPSFFASPMTPCLRSGNSCATVADFGSLVSLLLVGAMYGGANARVASQFNGC